MAEYEAYAGWTTIEVIFDRIVYGMGKSRALTDVLIEWNIIHLAAK